MATLHMVLKGFVDTCKDLPKYFVNSVNLMSSLYSKYVKFLEMN